MCVCVCVCGFVVISIDTLLSFPERLKVVCIETNKMHDVLSTALETDDRDYVTEEDLTVGNQLVWQKKKERVTVRVAQRGTITFTCVILIYIISYASLDVFVDSG